MTTALKLCMLLISKHNLGITGTILRWKNAYTIVLRELAEHCSALLHMILTVTRVQPLIARLIKLHTIASAVCGRTSQSADQRAIASVRTALQPHQAQQIAKSACRSKAPIRLII